MLSNLTRSGRLAFMCAVFAAAVALVAPGAANAERLTKCTGTAINGEGSTLQGLAMTEVWGNGAKEGPHAFNNAGQKNALACPGGPKVTYNTKGKTGSGQGMKNWYELGEFGPEAQAFVGTDNPPNAEVEKKIEELGTGGKVLTIPTLQAAVAIIINLPANCTATSEPKPGEKLGRLVLTQKEIEKVFRRTTTKFSQLKAGKGKISGTGCLATTEITRVVREDGSGTTATFKKWLELVNGKAEKIVNGKTWLESAEEPPANTEWPEEANKLVRGNGSGGVIKKVEETPGSIGYVNLANARNGKLNEPEGGEGKQKFWAKVENGQKVTIEGKAFKIFTDPSDNGPVAAKGNANCEETAYVAINPATGKAEKGKFPPSSTEKLWNIVTAEKKQLNYSICGFTYDLALTKYSGFGTVGKEATIGEATTAANFLEWVLNTGAEGGQPLIAEGHDYLGLPVNLAEPKKNVLKIAQEGAAKIQF